jgi:peptidoglycan/LPS O-acetylase OafA/YrhL
LSPITSQQHAGRSRIAALDGLRGIAILVVLGLHAHLAAFDGGYLGVDIFFVLSGFLITGVLIRASVQRGDRGRLRYYRYFLARRCARLMPAMVLSMVVVTAAASWLHMAAPSCAVLAVTYTMNLPWFGAADCAGPWHVTWSLAAEEQFYVLWPWLLAAIGWRLRPIWTAAAVAAAWLLSAIFVVAGGITGIVSAQVLSYSPAGRSLALLLGCSIAIAMAEPAVNRTLSPRGMHALLLVGLAGLALLVGVVAPAWQGPQAVMGPVAALFGGCVIVGATHARDDALGVRLLNCRVLRGLGVLSYSLYLQHMVPLRAARELLPDHPLLAAAVGLSIGLVFALLSYRLVEEPLRRRGQAWLTTRHDRTAASLEVPAPREAMTERVLA